MAQVIGRSWRVAEVVDGSKLLFSKTHLEYTCLPLTSIAMRSRSIFTKCP